MKTEATPAIEAVVVATLSKNPRRDVVLISSLLLFDIESEDLIDAWLLVEGANEVVGDTRKRAAHAAGSREVGAILNVTRRGGIVVIDIGFDES